MKFRIFETNWSKWESSQTSAVKCRQCKRSTSWNTKKRSWWWKNKIGAWGWGCGCWTCGWMYFTINSKKVVFSYVQVNTFKENAQTEKKIDESICYAIFLYHDRVFDIFLYVGILPCRQFTTRHFIYRHFFVDVLLPTFVYLIIEIIQSI
jgi:hypothetical protein